MTQSWTAKRLLAYALSAMMALPACGQANSAKVTEAGTTKDGVSADLQRPVALQKVVDVNGNEGWLVVTPVEAADEEAVLKLITEKNPENNVLNVASLQDPALAKAKGMRGFQKLSTFLMSSAEDMPLLKSSKIFQNVKTNIKSKIAAMSGFCSSVAKACNDTDNQKGLLVAFLGAGAIGGSSYMFSSASVESGLMIFSAYFTWISFLNLRQDWDHVMDKAGHKMSDVMTGIASLTGKQLSERGRHYSEIFGKFWLSFAVNSSLAALVLWGSDHLQSWQQVAWFGLILNYNIWDPAFQKKMRDGILSSRFMKKYYRFQAVVGSAVEAASYLNVPGFQLLLFSAMSAGVAYSLHHEKFDTVVGPKAHAVKLWVDEKTPVEPEHPLWYKTVMMAKQSCASLLTNTKAKLKSKFKLPRMVRAEPAADGWWWLPEGNN